MTTIADGHDALIRRIVEGLPSANVVTHLTPGHKDLPRYVCWPAGGLQRPLGVSGLTEAFPEISVLIEVEPHAGQTAKAMLASLNALFVLGGVYDGVTVERAPEPRPAIDDGAVYRQPVYVRGHFTF